MKSFAFVLAVVASSTAMAADGGASASCAPQLSPLQTRLYQKAVDGPDTLRDFLYIRRGILQLDVSDTATWAATVSKVQAACMKKVAQNAPAPSVTL